MKSTASEPGLRVLLLLVASGKLLYKSKRKLFIVICCVSIASHNPLVGLVKSSLVTGMHNFSQFPPHPPSAPVQTQNKFSLAQIILAARPVYDVYV